MADWLSGDDGGAAVFGKLSRAVSPLQDAGYDPEQLRADPDLRAQVLSQIASPFGLQPAQAQNAPQRPLTTPSGGSMAPRPATSPASPAPSLMGRMTPPAQPAASTATQTKPMAASGTNPAAPANAQPSLDQVGLEALQKGLALGGFAENTARDLASSTGPDTTALEAARTKNAMPTPLYGPDGKMLPQYEPSLGRRIWRGVEGGLEGLATGGIHGALLGAVNPATMPGDQPYGAPNKAYQTAEATREANLASEDQQIKEAQDKFKAMTDARKSAAAEARQGVTSYADIGKNVAELEKNQLTQQKNTATEREHGLKRDDQGNLVPLSYEEMPPEQQAQFDLRRAQQDAATARAELDRSKNDPNSPAFKLAQGRLAVAQQNAATALQRLGLSAREFGFHQDQFYNPQPTATERQRGDLAQSAVDRVAEMRSILQKHPEFFGPGAGRAQKVATWLGSQDPDAQTYQSAARYLADHSAGIFGARGEYIMNQLHSLTDPHFNPAALNAALDEAERTAQHFVKAGTVHGRPTAPQGNGPSPNGPNPNNPPAQGWHADFPEAK
jgi:hypothetical protein